MATPLHDFGHVLRAIFRFGRTLSYALIGLFLLWAGFRVYEAVRWGWDVHWTLGVAVLLAIASLLGWFVGRPVARFLRMPVTIRPPVLPERSKRTPADLARHLDFVDAYVRALAANPEWTGSPDALAAALASCRALRADAARAAPQDLPALETRLAALERDGVAVLLAPLDRKATDAIRAEAVGVGIATAISPNGTLDAFVLLWRAANLVARVSNIYYGRPSPRGTLAILRDVSAATLASAYLQEVTEVAGGMVGAVAGSAVGMVSGPVLDGTLNAMGMLRIGYLAKARCRAFQAWTAKRRGEVAAEVLREVGHVAAGVAVDLAKTVGGGILRLPGRLLGKLVDGIGALFRPPEAREA